MKLITIAWMELKQYLRDKLNVMILLVFPLMLIFILGSSLSEPFNLQDRPPEVVRLAMMQQDTGPLQEGVAQFLESEEIKKYFLVEEVTSITAIQAQLRNGEADVGLVIPEQFSEDVLSGKSAEWELFEGNSQTKNMTAFYLLDAFIQQTNAYQAAAQHLGLEVLVRTGLGEETANGREMVVEGKWSRSGKSYSSMQYYAAQILMMFMLYSGMIAGISLVNEWESNILERLSSLPVPSYQLVLGKGIGGGAVTLLQALIIMLLCHIIYGVDWGQQWFLLSLILLLVILASSSLAMLVSSMLRSTKTVLIAFQAIILGMTFLSGGFVPISGTLAKLGKVSISWWATDGLLHMMVGNQGSAIWSSIYGLLIYTSLLSIAAVVVYRKAGRYA